MPLKILIALAMVNKSPVTTCWAACRHSLQQPVALQGHVQISCMMVAKVLSVLTVEVTVLIESQSTWMEGPRPTGSCRNPAETTVTFVTGFTTRLLMQISTKLEMLTTVIWELHWQNEIVSLLTIPMPGRLKNYAIILFFAPKCW